MQAAEMSRFGYKSVPESGTNGAGRDSRTHKENGTVVPSRFSVPVGVPVSRSGEGEKSQKPLAQAMPECAAWVEQLRLVLGAERVNAAMAAAQQARREHARIQATQGQHAADVWLRRQKWPVGRIYLAEGGNEVGLQLDGGKA